MNRTQLIEAGIDYEDGLSRFQGDTRLYERLLLKFPKSPVFPALLAAMETKDTEGALQAAHTLKGDSGNLGMKTLYEKLVPMVRALRAAQIGEAEDYLPDVMSNYYRIAAAIGEEK